MAPFAEVKDLVSVIALDVYCRSQAFGFYSCFSTKDDVGDQSTGARMVKKSETPAGIVRAPPG